MRALWSEQVVACLHSKSVPELKMKNQEQSLTASGYFLFFNYIEKHLNVMKGCITNARGGTAGGFLKGSKICGFKFFSHI